MRWAVMGETTTNPGEVRHDRGLCGNGDHGEPHGGQPPCCGQSGPGAQQDTPPGNEPSRGGCRLGRDASGGGPCAGRRHVNDDWNAGGEQLLDDGPHGIHEASWRIQLDDETLGPILLGLVDGFRDKFGCNGVNHAVDFDHVDVFFPVAEGRKPVEG